MKKILIFTLVLFSAMVADAAIDKSQMQVAYTAKTAGKVDFTVYNKADDKGFVILDNQDQVLGYSDRGSFDYDKIPDNMKWWLSQYQEQIESGARFFNDEDDGDDSIVVHPLLGDIEWSQGYPYCAFCPTQSGYYCVVGCGATAMSQIMLYHKWPLSGHGYYEYEWNNGTISRNFNKSVYDWDNMLPFYRDDAYTDLQASAAARLSVDAGVSIKMKYGTSSSGSNLYSPYYAFPRTFAYSNNIRYLYRNSFTLEEWEGILRDEIDAERPVFYRGQNTSGHAFVCDGYTKGNYFHFNWGWDGEGNGYFKIGALNVMERKYNSWNFIIVGLEPRKSVIVDGLCYEIISDSTAWFTYKDGEEYSEAISIKEEIEFEGKTYRVTGLAGKCVPELDCIPSIQVPWTTPIKTMPDAFSDSVYSHTVLIVPDGCVDAYASNSFWSMFKCIRDNAGNVVEYGDWKPVVDGVGTYSFSVMEGGTASNLLVDYRERKDAEGKGQFRVKNWSNAIPLYDVYLHIDYDSATGNCSIPYQYAGWGNSDNIDRMHDSTYVYVSDAPHFDPSYTYDEYPCKYDAETEMFTFNLVYMYGNNHSEVGVETFHIDRLDKSMSAIYDYDKTFGKKIGVRINVGDGIESCKYVFVEGEISKDSAAVVAQQIADGGIEGNKAVIGLSTYKPASVSKDYTMVIVGFDRNGVMRNFISPVFNYNDIYNMMLGDTNKDKSIDVSDITTIASYILGDKPSS
ncbi:MAG: C10 family peptidase, partial [Prevotellaceae bacterium]|nr:C10 family peptidase [Prevotellaceae bacterium]